MDQRFAAAVEQHVDNAVVDAEDFGVGVQVHPAALMNDRRDAVGAAAEDRHHARLKTLADEWGSAVMRDHRLTPST